MYHLRPQWRCGQFACNKIFIHSPYKMKQHRAYSVLLRPQKPVCDNQYFWRGEALISMPLRINRACRRLRVDWSAMKSVPSPVLKCKVVGSFTPFLMTNVPFCVFWMDSPEIWRELSLDWWTIYLLQGVLHLSSLKAFFGGLSFQCPFRHHAEASGPSGPLSVL